MTRTPHYSNSSTTIILFKNFDWEKNRFFWNLSKILLPSSDKTEIWKVNEWIQNSRHFFWLKHLSHHFEICERFPKILIRLEKLFPTILESTLSLCFKCWRRYRCSQFESKWILHLTALIYKHDLISIKWRGWHKYLSIQQSIEGCKKVLVLLEIGSLF